MEFKDMKAGDFFKICPQCKKEIIMMNDKICEKCEGENLR